MLHIIIKLILIISKLSVKSFPLCMRYLHETLKQNHHLKHYGRLQYLLFLKGKNTLSFIKIQWKFYFNKRYWFAIR
jgi:DNA primase large subunit